jgi:serine/threonine-protein kinase RsbW
VDVLEVLVEFPARPEFLRLARLAAADVATRAGFDYEEVEDLRIAVSELCALISVDETQTVSLRFRLGEDRVEVSGSTPYLGAELAANHLELSRALVGAVVDDHSLAADGSSARFQLTKRRHAD